MLIWRHCGTVVASVKEWPGADGTRPDPTPGGMILMLNQSTPTTTLCGCGCGLPASTDKRFVRGHNARVYDEGIVKSHTGYSTPCHIWPGRVAPDGYGRTQH